MPTFGTDADGFRITFEEPARLLRVRAYGFWSPEVAATFAASVIEACRPPRRAKELVVDADDLKPQREEPGLGIERACVLATAYTISTFRASPAFGGATMNCTNVLRRIDGAWKIVHHHADRTPAVEKSLEQMVSS